MGIMDSIVYDFILLEDIDGFIEELEDGGVYGVKSRVNHSIRSFNSDVRIVNFQLKKEASINNQSSKWDTRKALLGL